MSKLPEEDILDKLEYLEKRIAQIETLLGIRKVSQEEFKAFDRELTVDELKQKPSDAENETEMESKIGEFGLGWLGSIVLLFGIAFITQYIQKTGQPLFSSIFGYLASGTVFFISYYISKSITGLSAKLNLISYVLIYFVTLRLHFFTDTPLFAQSYIPLALLVLICILQFYFSIKKHSEFRSSISFIMLMFTAYISSSTHFMLALITLAVIFSVYLLHKNNWWKLVLLSQFLSYLSFIIWYIVHLRASNITAIAFTDQHSIAYLFVCVSAFSMISLFKKRDSIPEAFVFISIILNGLFFNAILTMYVVAFYMTNYIGIFLSISLICLIFSAILKKYSEWEYTRALYALYGFVSISIAIYGVYALPLSFFLLTIQSLLVVSIAIWFRSRLIIVMNFVLFIFLIIGYYSTSKSIDPINFSIPFIAIISARIINWQRNRLDIKTDLIRNIYMIIGFFTMLYALYMAVPEQYVILSWTITSVVYFLVSILLRNIKYRWMAIFTMIAAAIYLFIVDLANIEIIYRIFAFMFLAAISITISIYYTKIKKKKTGEENENKNSVQKERND